MRAPPTSRHTPHARLQTRHSTFLPPRSTHPSPHFTHYTPQLPAMGTTTLHTFVIPADTTAPSTLHILRYVTAHTDSTGPILTTLQSLLPHALHNTSLFRLQPRHSTFYTLQSPHTHTEKWCKMAQGSQKVGQG